MFSATPAALANAVPVYLGGANYTNLAGAGYTQIKSGGGVLSGVTVNTPDTSASIALYDGLSSVVTISIANPGVITWPAHGLPAGAAVVFQTASALPAAITAGTKYYVLAAGLTANGFEISATPAGSAISTFGDTQTGPQTCYNISAPVGTFAAAAQASLPIGVNGARLQSGLIAIVTDSGGAANITVYSL